MSEIFELNILGRTYPLQAEDEGSDIRAVGAIVSERVDEIRKVAPDMALERVAILAALNVADAWLQEQAAVVREVDQLRARIAAIQGRLDGLAADPAPGQPG